jgi:cholesterol oxidase
VSGSLLLSYWPGRLVQPEHFDAVVVGSGFGGAVMAHELAQAGRSVCVLERGKAYPPGAFARSPHAMRANFWDPSEGQHGLYDVWSFDGIDVLVSSGLGGGSLIYANVLMRKDERWFVRDHGAGNGHEHWPVTRAELDPHYDAAERLIGVNQLPPHLRERLHKAREFAAAAGRAGLSHRWLPLAVSFAGPGQADGEPIAGAPPNRYGQTRLTCRLCGECDLGCNYGSKHTLDLTVLSAAERAGAELRTRCQVCAIEPLAGAGYRVGYVVHAPEREGRFTDTKGLPMQAITCRTLVLAAGTLGSTYLLFRNRRHLPGLGPALGRRFSGNGDFLGLALEGRDGAGVPRTVEASRGPVITGGVRVDDAADGGEGRGFYVEDAGYPELFNWLIEAGLSATPGGVARMLKYWFRVLRERLGLTNDSNFSAEMARLFGETVLTRSSLPLLGMGRDVPDGRMWLGERDCLELEWKNQRSEAFFQRLEATMKLIARELGAHFRPSPMFSLEGRLVTVHPLGGCAMGRHPAEGVVDAWGEVFGHPGLFVADGAVMPGPVGGNPSLTIAALAHRFAGRVADRLRNPQRVPHLPRRGSGGEAARAPRDSLAGNGQGAERGQPR